jgi:hypothetical protein
MNAGFTVAKNVADTLPVGTSANIDLGSLVAEKDALSDNHRRKVSTAPLALSTCQSPKE